MNGAKSLTNPAAVPTERGAGWKRYKASLKYGFYVIFHPFDGFWDLVHEQRGSLLAAHTWLFLFLLTVHHRSLPRDQKFSLPFSLPPKFFFVLIYELTFQKSTSKKFFPQKKNATFMTAKFFSQKFFRKSFHCQIFCMIFL